MAATDIKLIRRKATVPDFGRNLTILYREKNFPLTDANGVVQNTEEKDENGNLIPQYFDFTVQIEIPSPIPPVAQRQAFIDALKAQADEIAKGIAQKRANDIVDKNKITSIVRTINDDTGVIFTGTYVIV